VKKDDFLGSSVEVRTNGMIESKEIATDLKLFKKPKEPIHIPNILYEFDKSNMVESSKLSLDTTVLKLMDINPELIIEIQAHTDGKGNDQYNLKLSQKRAESVVTYLKSKGIDQSRLKAQGYGESKPIAATKSKASGLVANSDEYIYFNKISLASKDIVFYTKRDNKSKTTSLHYQDLNNSFKPLTKTGKLASRSNKAAKSGLFNMFSTDGGGYTIRTNRFRDKVLIINQAPAKKIDKTTVPGEVTLTLYDPNEMKEISSGIVKLGKAQDFPSFGWDIEYGDSFCEVDSFLASQYLITNAEFLDLTVWFPS
jgi:hypothetical protein